MHLDAHSSSDSDSAPHPRVHPARAMRGFSCDFARGRCGHDELFHPHYTRTNLRKGDKILRCFPHCCPDHVSRSFCGASLHVEVHWDPHDATSSPPPSSMAVLPETIVFAKFRVKDTPGLAVGGHITLHEISQSLQNEANPHGEWISARSLAVSSVHHLHKWRFEVNPDARWYYHWESGVAKRHRLKYHVLDIYVLTPSPAASSSASASTADLRHRPLQVVALAQSPPFRLISFRRATPKAVQALAGPRVRTDAQLVDSKDPSSDPPSRVSSPGDFAPPSKRMRRAHSESLPNPVVQQMNAESRWCHHSPTQRPLYSGIRQLAVTSRPSSAESSRLPVTDITSAIDRRREHHLHHSVPASSSSAPFVRPQFPQLALPHPQPSTSSRLRASTSPAEALRALRLQRLFQCLSTVTINDALPYMDTFHRVYTSSLARSTGLRLATLSTGVSPIHAVHELISSAGLSASAGARSSLSKELTAILCELALWLSFDVDLHDAVHSTLARDTAKTTVLAQPRLVATYVAFAEWLERYVDAFLHDRGWRLEDIVDRTPPLSSASRLNHEDDPHDAYVKGLRCLVAQASELFIKQRSRHRGRQSVQVRSVLAGDWYCPLLQGGLRVISTYGSPPRDASLPVLFAFMRELGSIRVSAASTSSFSTAPLLCVSSLLNSHATDRLASELVLDNSSRWLRVLPSGVSTSSLSLGGLSWGDYIGSITPSSSSSTEVQVELFAWRSSACSTEDNADWIATHVRLQLWAVAPDTMIMQVTTSRGFLDRRVALRDYGLATLETVLAQLPLWPLQRKQTLVRAWQPQVTAEVRYVRVGGGP